MRGQPDILGEIHEDEIKKIACEAAEKKRKEQEETDRRHGKQVVLFGEEAPPFRGYVTYHDYDEYIEKQKGEVSPSLQGYFVQKIEATIGNTLEGNGWIRSRHRETRFYPPGTELPSLGHATP